jgi:putative hydroxymethylpyrimidine transport system permease protein
VKRLRPAIVLLALCALWELTVRVTGVPPYILPGPSRVLSAWVDRGELILRHAGYTTLEMVLGLLLGGALGIATALLLSFYGPARHWLLPLLVLSQAVPVFALAPLLVLWFGYGMGSKVAMATLVIYFPVTSSFFDGLRRTEPGWLDLARTMGASPLAVLRHIRLPAALPSLASGLRVAVAVAPIGAVVGEWVGSSAGLGYLMLHANARMQVDLMFAALITLGALALAFYFAADRLLQRTIHWAPDSVPTDP